RTNYKNLYMVANMENSTCGLLLSVIITGRTPGGRDSQYFRNNVLNQQMENVENTINKLKEISSKLFIAAIEVQPHTVPLAVIPPVVWEDEHQGVESLAKITPERIFEEIKNFIFDLAPIIFILLLVIGAIFYILSPIKIEYLSTGSEYIKWAIIGYFVLLVISAIFSALKMIFGAP
ncbi:MAG: pilin, partial [Patescibacteria group bacterium]|nr:pilin [Patescibacteria group bacterium]